MQIFRIKPVETCLYNINVKETRLVSSRRVSFVNLTYSETSYQIFVIIQQDLLHSNLSFRWNIYLSES